MSFVPPARLKSKSNFARFKPLRVHRLALCLPQDQAQRRFGCLVDNHSERFAALQEGRNDDKDGRQPDRRGQAGGAQGGLGAVKGEGGMVIETPGLSLLKSTFGLAALMALMGRPYIRAMVLMLSPGPRT